MTQNTLSSYEQYPKVEKWKLFYDILQHVRSKALFWKCQETINFNIEDHTILYTTEVF